VCPPWLARTAVIRSGIVIIYLSISTTDNFSQAWRTAILSSLIFVGGWGRRHTRVLSSCHTGSMGERSGEFGGWNRRGMLFLENHDFVCLLVWHDMLSCWKNIWPLSPRISSKKPFTTLSNTCSQYLWVFIPPPLPPGYSSTGALSDPP